jgi:hypothetical protein
VEGFAERVGTGPNGGGVGEGIEDGGFIEAEGRGGGGGPGRAIGKARDIAEVDIANAREGRADGIAQNGQGAGVEGFEGRPNGRFGTRSGYVFQLDGEGAVRESSRRGPGALRFVVRRDQNYGTRNFEDQRVAKIGLGDFDGVAGGEGAEGVGNFIGDAVHLIEDHYPVMKGEFAEFVIARGEAVDGSGAGIDESTECASEDGFAASGGSIED